MKRTIVISLCVLLLSGCGGSATSTRLDELQKNNEELTRRVKALEDDLLQADRKLIQHEQAMQQMYERLKQVENAVNKIEIGPSPSR
jgi:septal ring factor EnvC (AmiA/AmiB activator)